MEWLLKVVEGPMNGAEIALVSGLRVRVGSGADCDIVLADASLAATEFELDVTADAVSFIRGEETKTLAPYEIFEVGTSGFAVGPADGVWAELRRPKAAVDASSRGGDNPVAPEKEAASAEATGLSPQPEKGVVSAEETGTAAQPEKPRHSRGLVAVCCLAVLLIVVFLLWYFWPKVIEKCPAAEQARVFCHERAESWYSASKDWVSEKVSGKTKQSALPEMPKVTLADIAREHNLTLANCSLASVNYPLLKGNVSRRTERMAIRALAQSVDPQVKFDLTDDESLAAAANELMFVVTEGAIKVASASNRVVSLVGYAASAAALERIVRALDADVKGIAKVDAKGVTLGGVPPPRDNGQKTTEAKVFADVKPVKPAPRARGTKTPDPMIDFPIAGILIKPYKTVVMNSGMRLAEGAQLGDATIERIESDRLVLRKGGSTFEWKP